MILGALTDADAYLALAPGFAEAFDFLRSFDPATPDGRHPIRGDQVFALVQTYQTGPAAERRFESHRVHWDVQFVADGQERLLHAPVGQLTALKPYNPTTDLLLYADPEAASSLLIRSGDFALLGPGDGHKPGCMAGAKHTVRKVVIKVRIVGVGA